MLLLFSCSQEELPGVAGGADNSGIVFRVALPAAETRSYDTTVAGDLNGGFYVSAICPEDDAAAGNALNPYFTEQFAIQLERRPGYFGMFNPSSEQWVWPTTRHGKQGKLRFFAFYPSREELKQSAGVASNSEYFELKNNSKKNGSVVTYDYRIAKFKVNKEITRHVDFVTATTEGSRKKDEDSGVKLEFEHQLSRIALKAWGASTTAYNVEIAGVRIGRAVVESDFNFAGKPANYAAGDNTVSGNWVNDTQKRNCVEYIFREGDTVIPIGSGSYTSEASAASIMGNSGWAMVIPCNHAKWNHTGDADNKKQGLYFSVLLRVKGRDKNNTLLYPYIEGADLSSSVTTDNMNVIYFSIQRTTGKVLKRLYKNKEDRKFYTDPDFSEAYTVPDESEEIRNYGWAAVPYQATWKAGYEYTYTLDYTNGVGVEDPDDLYPGKPIISKILVGVTEGTSTWPTVDDFERGDGVDITDNITIR